MALFSNPFINGLLLGLVIAVFIAISGWNKRRGLRKENEALKLHLNTQMSITAKGNQVQSEQLAQLAKQNENLRISFAALKNQASKAELQKLYLYDKTIHLMYERAPGFAPVWENALKEAEAILSQTETGMLAWIRKSIRPSLLGNSNSLRTLSNSSKN